MRRFIDGLIILFVLGAVVSEIIGGISTGPSERRPAPDYRPETIVGDGRALPPPSARDRTVMVQEGRVTDSTGTAWPVSADGIWMTARHVTRGCRAMELRIDGDRYTVDRVRDYERGDLALLWLSDAPRREGLILHGPDVTIGSSAWGYGWPSGRPGAVEGALLGRQNMYSRGDREPVLAWVDRKRLPSRLAQLGGISGGPVLLRDGQVIGALVAGSDRRGRFFTTAPANTATFLRRAGVPKGTARWQNLTRSEDPVGLSMERDLRDGRRRGAIAQVLCYVESAGRRPSPRRWSGQL